MRNIGRATRATRATRVIRVTHLFDGLHALRLIKGGNLLGNLKLKKKKS